MPTTPIDAKFAAAVAGIGRWAAAVALAGGLILSPVVGLAAAEDSSAPQAAAGSQVAAPTKGVSRIGVVSAFEPEWQSLKADLANPETVRINGVDFVTGKLAGKNVVLFLSGVSMVNAAMTTQLALDRFGIEAIVFSGIAGGVDPALDIGDVVVAGRWAQYLEAVFARKDGEDWTLPSYAKRAMPNHGMIFPQPVEVRSRRSEATEEMFWFETDRALLDVARQVAEKVELDRCAGKTCLTRAPHVVVGGSGVSGTVFVDNAEFRKYVAEAFDASVLDMESAAVAHVAYANDVPFIAFRSLSDLAGGGEGENEMATFFALASENSARVVKAFVAAMPAHGN
ncbi:5'-methylthioadenosine/S-adenosylhomocysteine nucleosidase [Jiella pelagia]|uniref:5'-methylthioadenosine/S-adenosylhomocysteine nucleosidase n=1 Tax=Jiella pelagia TaxID=2986949 RepID=A0ABY7BYA4_9HYPH|nr:5'-methylthioadenosine/S-adenosylhomocysteine nucleosidase [Jiella pelagia]WAP68819.1 5'-methylthioadenosine/S-adenosylhomocysteine nucleosidase [Jiella pelagia]